MPLLKLQTNLNVAETTAHGLLESLTTLVVRELGKPREVVQVLLEDGCALTFAGTTDPNALVELRALGLAEGRTAHLSKSICDLLERKLGIAPARVFINFQDFRRTMWGWNGKTLDQG